MPTHAETRILPHTPDQMYDLVADIERYPEFLPWCVGLRVRKRWDNKIRAEMKVGFNVLRETFSSEVTLTPRERIDVVYFEGPFRYLNNHWIFRPHGDGACAIDFFIDFEFRSAMLQRLAGVVFNEAVKRMVSSFERRADVLYGSGNNVNDQPV
jgi:coenzyme Q-binding protein COQ10